MQIFQKYKTYLYALLAMIFAIALFWLIFRTFTALPNYNQKVYSIGRDESWYPIDLRGKESNMVGFTNDLLQAIAQEQGVRFNLIEVGPHALFDGLHIGRYDGVLSSKTPHFINQKTYAFSDPFYLVGPVLIVKENGPRTMTLKDIEGKVVGIERGAFQVFNIPEPPDAAIIPYNTALDALENLDENRIDAVILEGLRAYVYTEGIFAGRLRVASSPLTLKGLRLVTMKKPMDLLLISQYNEGLQAVMENGTYKQLLDKWGLIDTMMRENKETQ